MSRTAEFTKGGEDSLEFTLVVGEGSGNKTSPA